MPGGVCKLCGSAADLQLSHILPAFAYRWLRDSSGTGHIRVSQDPNRRVQDGLKLHWLCVDCEQRFSRAEDNFSSRLFHPYLKHSGGVFAYSEWLPYFCTSLSWRVLCYFRDVTGLSGWDAEESRQADQAEIVWRSYLLGESKRLRSHFQHLLPLDRITEATGDLATNLNRYLMRAVHMDIIRGPQANFTYSKLGRFVVIGQIAEPHPSPWKGTKVQAAHGCIEPRNYQLPGQMRAYWNQKAGEMRQKMAGLSPRQKQKIDDAFRANVDRFVGSDSMQALLADIEIHGDDAFSPVGPASNEA